jgi:hypothetical protein
VSALISNEPTLTIDSDRHKPGLGCVSVSDLEPELILAINGRREAGRILQSILRVKVVGMPTDRGEDLPDVFGRYEVLDKEFRFIPHFPFEAGVRFRATFDPRPLGRSSLSTVLTLEFSFPKENNVGRSQVEHVYPSGDSLPENLLRFYVCFSSPMQRGRAEKHLALLGPDGQPAPDTLYRPPVELWDRSMRHLTILLDPGRLKRGVGPNRDLGPPLKPGLKYTLTVDSDMVDFSGRPLRESYHKSFDVTEAVRNPIALDEWRILPPATNSRQPLVLLFPKPLDWALLWHSITIAPDGGHPIEGRIAIDQGEKQWSLTPTSAWAAGAYRVRVASSLEDICGNSLLGAFDRHLQTTGDLSHKVANHSMPLRLE